MTVEQWPTAEAINRRIAKSEQANLGTSRLHGKGDVFLQKGTQYNINPGIVVAISQRECQLGAAPNDFLPPLNNFGGNTAGSVTVPGQCGKKFVRDREWKVFCTVDDGIGGIFQNINTSVYASAKGNLGAIMLIYAPPGDGNNHDDIFRTFAQVGEDLGISITRESNIYGSGGQAVTPGGDGIIPDSLNPKAVITDRMNDLISWITDYFTKIFPRIVLFGIGILILVIGLWQIGKIL